VRKLKESEIQKMVIEWLRWHKWFVYKNHQTLGSYKGVADLTAIKNGKVWWIEIKTPAGKLSEWQKNFREDILKHGGNYVIIRDVSELEKYFTS